MKFENLEERMRYYRQLADHKLMTGTPVVMMLDGRSFSKIIKKKFVRPFDEDFIEMMNETARYLMQNMPNCKFAYVQSDEISLFLSDYENINSDSFFGYRLCKMQSIAASLASAKFNQLLTMYHLKQLVEADKTADVEKINDMIASQKLVEFDCRAWNVPTENDAYAWFLYRQYDCIRNSKQQAAQTYLSHKSLLGLDTDKQVEKLKEEKNINWHHFPQGQKFGRFIYKVTEQHHNKERDVDYERTVIKVFPAWELGTPEGRAALHQLDIFKKWTPSDTASTVIADSNV